MESPVKQYWEQTLSLLRTSEYFDGMAMSWIEKSDLFKIEGGVAYVSYRSVLANNLLQENKALFEETLSSVWGSSLDIQIISQKEMEQMMPEESLKYKARNMIGHEFNSVFTFDSFVQGPSNQEALVACKMIAQGQSLFNPLLIYGNSGLGKTHILNAMGNYITHERPGCKVNYMYAGDLVSLLLEAMRTKSTSFSAVDVIKEQLLDCDYFFIDDIQNLRNNSCQEVFFTVFNELIRRNKQIILTSDTHPQDIPTLTKRLTSRFQSGLIVSIRKPETETAKLILKKKIAGREDVFPVDDDVLDFLAVSYSDDVRALEGVLNRLIFSATLFNPETISMSFTLGILKDEPAVVKTEEISAKTIKKTVINYYGLSYQDLEGKSRQRKIAQARQICIYLMRDILNLPYAAIGREMGGRDHTTISSSCSKVRKRIEKEADWKEAVDTLKRKITG